MRQDVDPDAQLAELLALLVDPAVDARPVQLQPGGQAADPRTHDDDLHGPTIPDAVEPRPDPALSGGS